VIRRVWVASLLLGSALPGWGQAVARMAKDAHPNFDVASIKLTDPEFRGQQMSSTGPRIKARGQTVTLLMMFAYGLHKSEIVGAPGWMNDVRYDVSGVADTDGEPDVKQMQEMFRKLLAERFGLTFHSDKKELAYYALTVAKGGSKLVKSKSPEDENPDETGNGNSKEQVMKFTNCSMNDLALSMQYFADKPTVDETGLQGRYDFTLRWLQNAMQAPEDGAPPMLFTAMEEQLGLKLEPKRGPVEVMVVDKVERPTEN
jgi:uncharacterized protein (TIGR03435 family)